MSVVIEQRREHVISCEVGLIIFLLLNYLIYKMSRSVKWKNLNTINSK